MRPKPDGVDPVHRRAAELYREGFGRLQDCVAEARRDLKNRPQDQRSLRDQLADLISVAAERRMYDAADYLQRVTTDS